MEILKKRLEEIENLYNYCYTVMDQDCSIRKTIEDFVLEQEDSKKLFTTEKYIVLTSDPSDEHDPNLVKRYLQHNENGFTYNDILNSWKVVLDNSGYRYLDGFF